MTLPKLTSRRIVLMASAATAGIGLGWVTWSSSRAITEIDRSDALYIPNAKNKQISFGDAKLKLENVVKDEIELSQKDFGVKYTEEQIARIAAQIWDAAQLDLIRYYKPKEQPKTEH